MAIISNSGNMVNTIASYLLAGGFGTSFGVSTGKDTLLLASAHSLLASESAEKAVRIFAGRLAAGALFPAEADVALQRLLAEAEQMPGTVLLVHDLDVALMEREEVLVSPEVEAGEGGVLADRRSGDRDHLLQGKKAMLSPLALR